MKSITLLIAISGIAFLACGAILFLLSVGVIGINDAEYARVNRLERVGKPDLFKWSEWTKNDGSIYLATDYISSQDNMYRKGYLKNSLLSYTVYEIRNRDGIFPAFGPNSGASYDYTLAKFSFVFGWIQCCIAILLAFKQKKAEQDAAANP